MNEWISVKDALPKESGRYLIYTIKAEHAHNAAAYDYPYPCCKPNIAYYNKFDNFWKYSSFDSNLPLPPTHWMTLPEPPK